ncbi:septum formation family protein [Nocardioides sp.]|uniref:septum formation family protein n=1 Tax=Nocardioides sp. TaxID=35761 RepID=UPI002B8E5376|nr:septum formation family protein [Nocardioides sp.]HXH79488.1 septum formation family protein [Nocardioides sp.]
MRLLGLGAVLVALLLGGCSQDARPAASPTSSSPSVPATTAAVQPTASPAPRPARNGCHRLTLAQAVAPAVSGTAVSCAAKHTSHTYKIGRLPLVSSGHLLAVDSPSVQSSVADTCTSLLGAHVGGTPEEVRLSMVEAIWFTPSVTDAAAGADWFRCDVVALAGAGRLAPLPRSSMGMVGASDRFAMCGTASPDAASFERVPCSSAHSWVAVSTVPLAGKAYPSVAAASVQMESACRSAARSRAEDPLDFTWSEERPSREQWDAGRRYGICWAPA